MLVPTPGSAAPQSTRRSHLPHPAAYGVSPTQGWPCWGGTRNAEIVGGDKTGMETCGKVSKHKH